jgi:peptide deformylase
VPGLYFPVKRPRRVTLTGLDLEGREFTREGEDLLGRIFLHETDHLDGYLLLDRLDPDTRKEAMKALRERDGLGGGGSRRIGRE